MKKVYFITGNKSKFKEARQIVLEANVSLVQKNLNLDETRSLDQKKVAVEKARKAFKKLKKPILVDDTALYFEEYKSFPGTYTKSVFQSIGFKGIERLLKGRNRKAYFRTFICYKDSKNEKIFSGVWKGRIIPKVSKKFNPEWEYNSIFVPSSSRKVLSEIPLEERAKKSHRKKAFNKLIKYLEKMEGGEKSRW